MKNYTYLSLFAIVLLFSSSAPHKDFEGKLVYSINYIEIPDEVKGMESMLPKEYVVYIQGQKIRWDQKIMGGGQTVIVDAGNKTSNILMDMMGQKANIFISSEEMAEARAEIKPPTITYLKGKKVIAGFKCSKALIVNEDGTESAIWYSKKIKIKHKDFEYLNGFPLEYESKTNGVFIRLTVTEVEKMKVSDDKFMVPEGYTKMTMDEWTQMLGN